jgi:hypothetical protein
VDWADLLSVNSQAYGSYIDAFRACSQSHCHLEDFYTDPDNKDNNTDSDTETETEDDLGPKDGSDTNYRLADFEAFARRRLHEDFTLIDLGQDIGTREIDRNYD